MLSSFLRASFAMGPGGQRDNGLGGRGDNGIVNLEEAGFGGEHSIGHKVHLT